MRETVRGKTKAEVRDKLRALHRDLEVGLPQVSYTVGDALDDWLEHGLDGRSERTVKLYRDTIAKALKEQLGAAKVTRLTATDVHRALTALVNGWSTRAIQIGHNVLVRAIQHAERADLVGATWRRWYRSPLGQGSWTEALSAAHHCLLGPDHVGLRQDLAAELVRASFRSGRRGDLLMGLMWRTVDSFADGDPRAERLLGELRDQLNQRGHLAVGFVVSAIDVMLAIRAGRLDEAEALTAAAPRAAPRRATSTTNGGPARSW